jgi:UDP:flavonoid glycosyltransferase YjiC (YdhE family)
MPRLLFAPLDWGLGHATRCIPLIKECRKLGCEVVIAAAGPTKKLLKNEFPELRFLDLQGYSIRYGKNLTLSVFRQLPRILRTIRLEKKWLQQLLLTEKFDAIISDNRPGLNHPSIPCIYITHQLQIRSGKGILTDRLLFRMHQQLFRKFTEVWVPDLYEPPGIAGILSHPQYNLNTVRYMGLLSRLTEKKEQQIKWDVLILLSGPEPQRTELEEKLLSEMHSLPGKILLVRGLPDESVLQQPGSAGCTLVNYMNSSALADALADAAFVVCRSGYTTIMDLLKCKKKAVLIPTPGQTEQEYLSNHLEKLGLFPSLHQKEATPEKILNRYLDFNYSTFDTSDSFNLYQQFLKDWLARLSRSSNHS